MNKIKSVSPIDAAKWLGADEAIIIDVREASELAQASLPGAKHMPMSKIDLSVLDGTEGKRVLFICAHGMRSMRVAMHLVGAGVLTEAYNITDGVAGWADAGLPVDRARAA